MQIWCNELVFWINWSWYNCSVISNKHFNVHRKEIQSCKEVFNYTVCSNQIAKICIQFSVACISTSFPEHLHWLFVRLKTALDCLKWNWLRAFNPRIIGIHVLRCGLNCHCMRLCVFYLQLNWWFIINWSETSTSAIDLTSYTISQPFADEQEKLLSWPMTVTCHRVFSMQPLAQNLKTTE
jgi:hypothetical protein